MKIKNLRGIQKRILNKKERNPFAILPGFNSKRFLKCQFIVSSDNNKYKYCQKKSFENTSYCKQHFFLCHTTQDVEKDKKDNNEKLARKDFLKDNIIF